MSEPELFGAIDSMGMKPHLIHLINATALQLILIDKGIIAPEEYRKYHMRATHYVDQLWQAKQDQRKEANESKLKKLEEEFPVIGKLLANLFRKNKPEDL